MAHPSVRDGDRLDPPGFEALRFEGGMTPFAFNTTREIIFGSGSSASIGPRAGSMLGKRVLLVTDPGIRKLGLIDHAISSFAAQGIGVVVFDAVEADPSL